MATLSARTLICNVAALFSGRWGAVSAQAHKAGCSRQAIYQQETRVLKAVEDAQQPGPTREALLEENRSLREENRQLWAGLETTVDFPAAKQQRFAVTGSAMGLSLQQIAILLALVLPPVVAPKRSTLGRWVQQAADKAGRALQVLDRLCQNLVTMACLDEIFLRRQPVLMAVEPLSLTWMIGQRTKDRTGETWCAALLPWKRLTYTALDGGNGLRRGVDLTVQRRQEAGPALPLAMNLDNFHIQQVGHKALRGEWQEAERIWQQAEQADRVLASKEWHGQDIHSTKSTQGKARAAWVKASAALAVAECRQAAYERLVAALEVFRSERSAGSPAGLINNRAWATAEIEAALKDLPGPDWAKLRRMALDPRALTFLDRLNQQLEEAEPRADLRAALVELWRVRHPHKAGKPHQAGKPTAKVKRDPRLELIHTVICHKLDANWQAAYLRVSRVLRSTVRSSSVVECMNSVLRMHQARHRGLSQRLIDLKRLYWNCRTFAEGKRADHCPYQHLCLNLPTYDWWDLLHMAPEELAQKLSTAEVAK